MWYARKYARLRRVFGAGLLGLGLLSAPGARGQAAWVTVSGGYGVASMKWGTMNQFLDSYTTATASTMTSKPTLGGGQVRSLMADVAGFGCIGFQRLDASAVARFSSGAERTFAIQQNVLVAAVEPSFQRKNVFLGGVLGFYSGTMHVGTSIRYPDGTRSWGKDLPLNGTYGGLSMGGFVGAKAGLTWKALAVTARIEYFTKGLVKEDLSDRSNAKNTTANAFGGVASPDFLPLDYGAYSADPFNYSAVDQSVANDLTSLRGQVQLGLFLFPLDN